MIIKPALGLVKELVAIRTALLNGANMGLFTNSPSITPSSVLLDFTEATFGGYAQSTLTTWGVPFVDPNTLQADVIAPAAVFTAATPITGPQTINGWFLLDKDGDYYGADYFRDPGGTPSPVPMVNDGQQLTVLLELIANNIAG